MADYKNTENAYAMSKIRDMFALVPELAAEKERLFKRYSPDVANEKYSELQSRYRDANHEARNAVKEAIRAAHSRVEKSRSEMLHIGNAEEDFKLLSLPVTLSPSDLRAMVKRNEGNDLFARAVSQYAKDHNYNDSDFRLGTMPPFEEHHRQIDEADKHLMRYCEEDRLDVAINHDWRGLAFNRVDKEGLFANL